MQLAARCCLSLAIKVDETKFSRKKRLADVIKTSKEASQQACMTRRRLGNAGLSITILQVIEFQTRNVKQPKGMDATEAELKQALEFERVLLSTLGMAAHPDKCVVTHQPPQPLCSTLDCHTTSCSAFRASLVRLWRSRCQ